MSLDADGQIAGARATAPASTEGASPAAAERLKLQRLASEFEAMLLTRMLREMREAGRWADEGESDTAGATPLLEIVDAELATHLARSQGLGIAREMLAAFDRSAGSSGPVDPAPAPATGGPEPDASGWPEVTSPFGMRRDPFTGQMRFHRGVDLRAAYGEDVTARAPGRVRSAGPEGSYGTTVVLEHADGSRTRFAHLSVALVRPGDWLEAGQPVGRAGSSGRATGPHLHLERLDSHGRPVDPLSPDR